MGTPPPPLSPNTGPLIFPLLACQLPKTVGEMKASRVPPLTVPGAHLMCSAAARLTVRQVQLRTVWQRCDTNEQTNALYCSL